MEKIYTVQELAKLVQGEVVGDPTARVRGLNGLERAREDELTFITSAKKKDDLVQSRAGACIIPRDLAGVDRPAIRVDNPDLAAAIIHNFFLKRQFTATGIHPSVQVGTDCTIDPCVSIHALVSIGDRVRIGREVEIHPGVVLGDGVTIGEGTVLYPNVTICAGCVIGRRVIIHPGAVIGSDGFGFATDRTTGEHVKRPQVGIVRIDDDVEIGANTCIDRAAFGETRIRRGVKIDNLVQVAHNVVVGENSILVSQVGIAGSTTLGRNVVLGGKTAVAGHIHLGDGVMTAAMSGVHNSQENGAVLGGAPAFDIRKWGRAATAFMRLPEMHREIRRLKKEISRLSDLLQDRDRDA